MTKTFKQLEKAVEELVDGRIEDEQRIEEQENLIKELKSKVEDLEDRQPNEHFHKLDRINFQDLQGGFPAFDSAVTHLAEDGKAAVYTVGSTSYFAVKVAKVWKKTTLTDV